MPVLEYYVRAYDRDPSGNVRASTDSTHIFVTQTNNPPYEVENLALTQARERRHEAHLDSGPRRRTRTPATRSPSTAIYRDGIAMSNRYERYFDSSGSPNVNWTDITTNGVLHTYWVTSVDQNYAESALRPPGDRMSRLRRRTASPSSSSRSPPRSRS